MFNHSSWHLAKVLNLDHRELRLFIDELKDKLNNNRFEQNFERLILKNVLTYYVITDDGLEILLKALAE